MTPALYAFAVSIHATATGLVAKGSGVKGLNPQITQPPGTDSFSTILGWVMWIVVALCILGVFLVAGRMAVNHRRGEGADHASALGWVLGACVLVGSGAGLVGSLV